MYTLSSLATRGARTPYHNRGEPVARLCSLSLSLSLPWEPAKVELVAQSEGRKRASSFVFIFVIIHSSIPHSLPEQNEILPPLSTRTKVTGMQTNRRLVRLFGKHSCQNRAPLPPLPLRRNAANAMGMGGERARDSFVTVKVAGRKEGRRPLFPLNQKKHSIRRMNEGNWWRRTR